MISAARSDPLRLVAPWYRWRRQAESDGLSPRETRPALQKFASPDFVNGFLADPQRSYRFTGRDVVRASESSPFTSAIRRIADTGLHPTGLRKVFRDTHKRHYLVACELHCDVPGFPDARLERACEMGFVVRRRRPSDPDALRQARRELREEAGTARAGLLRFTRRRMDLPVPGALRSDPDLVLPAPPGLLSDHQLAAVVARYRSELEEIRARRTALERLDGIPWILEGWVPVPDHPGVGRWEPVDDAPQEFRERVHPLNPLIPDPTARDHSGGGARLLFGVVPTGGSDTDPRGEPRFDAGHVYEVRCFVREHREGCPRTRARADCPGRLVWSEPGEPYRIAAHNDVDGTRNCVVTAELPDMGELAARAAALPPGGAGGVRMVAPDDSNLEFQADGMEPTSGGLGGREICTFTIPLITIVATFLFRLVLPVVVFLFQLYFLLRLKLCIPPSIEIDAGLEADIEAAGPSLDVRADLRADIVTELNAAFPTGPGGEGVGDRLASDPDEYSNSELWEMLQDLAAAPPEEEAPDDGGTPDDGGAPDASGPLTSDLVPEERVEARPRVDDPELLGALT